MVDMEQSITVDIAAPAERVWEVLTDVERWSDWTESVRWVRRLDEGPLRTGSTAKISQPKVPTVDWVVTEFEPVDHFTWVNAGPGATTTANHSVEPLPDGGTRVRLSVNQSGVIGALVGRAYKGLTERYLQMEAAGLKRRCEGDDAGVGAV
jgi:hypothetical protein